jgi:hypothetical protein
MTPRGRWTIIGIALAAMAGTSAAAEDRVTPLLSNPHGLNRLSAEDRARIDALRSAMSDEEVAILVDALRLPASDAELLDTERLQSEERALVVLGMVGGLRAQNLLVEHYRAVSARLQAADGMPAEDAAVVGRTLLGLRRTTLEQLGEAGGAELLSETIDGLTQSDPSTQVVILRYVGKVGAGRPDVLQRLEALQGHGSAPLGPNSALLAATVAALKSRP